MTLRTSLGAVCHRSGRPTRLCVIAPDADQDGPLTARLCYRVRRNGTDAADAATTTIASTFGTASGALGPVEELCLPAEVVPDAP